MANQPCTCASQSPIKDPHSSRVWQDSKLIYTLSRSGILTQSECLDVDGASINRAAMQTVNVVYSRVLNATCFSYAIAWLDLEITLRQLDQVPWSIQLFLLTFSLRFEGVHGRCRDSEELLLKSAVERMGSRGTHRHSQFRAFAVGLGTWSGTKNEHYSGE